MFNSASKTEAMKKHIELRELDPTETKAIYKEICDAGLEPVHIDYDRKSADVYHILNGKTYRLIYDNSCDWFCDIIYEGNYEIEAK